MIFGYFVIRHCRGTIEPTCAIEEDRKGNCDGAMVSYSWCRGPKQLIIYFSADCKALSDSAFAGSAQAFNNKLVHMPNGAHRVTYRMLWICDYSSRQFCDWSQSERLQADGDALTIASDRVVITGTGPCVLVTSLMGHWLTRLAADTCYRHGPLDH